MTVQCRDGSLPLLHTTGSHIFCSRSFIGVADVAFLNVPYPNYDVQRTRLYERYNFVTTDIGSDYFSVIFRLLFITFS